jgi:hypothetical protein
MRRARLVLYCAAMAAWTVALILIAAGALDAARIALWAALGTSAVAALTGIGHASAELVRHWRANGLPTWRGRR